MKTVGGLGITKKLNVGGASAFAGAATFAGDVTVSGTCTGCGSTLYGGTDNADCNKITEKDPTFTWNAASNGRLFTSGTMSRLQV
jgi:hypothetical protein